MRTAMGGMVAILAASFLTVSCGPTKRKQLEIGERKVIGARLDIVYKGEKAPSATQLPLAQVTCNNREVGINSASTTSITLEHRGLIEGASCVVEIQYANQTWQTERSFFLVLKDKILSATAEVIVAVPREIHPPAPLTTSSKVNVVITEVKDCGRFDANSNKCAE